jgi:hypothetical protein
MRARFEGRQLRRSFAFLLVIVGISLIGLASHNTGDPANDHPSVTHKVLTDLGEINIRIRDTTSPIRVMTDVYATDVELAIGRWNSTMGRTIFQSVTSAPYELKIQNRGSLCGAFPNYNAFWTNDIGHPTCNIDVGVGDPLYEMDVSSSKPGYILLGSLFGSQITDKATAFTHEMGHELGIMDHYYSPGDPACRGDVESIMENWGCSGGSPTNPHDVDDMGSAYKTIGVPWVNYIWMNSSSQGVLHFDSVNRADRSLHNEKASAGLRWRRKTSLEGSQSSSGTKSRSSSLNEYSWTFTPSNGQWCYSANGRNNYVSGEGNDGSEVCYNRQVVGSGYAVGTSDTHDALNQDFFRLWNYSGGQMTNARLTYTSGTTIYTIGTINNGASGQAGNLNLAKGNYQLRFTASGTSYILDLGLDDCGLYC